MWPSFFPQNERCISGERLYGLKRHLAAYDVNFYQLHAEIWVAWQNFEAKLLLSVLHFLLVFGQFQEYTLVHCKCKLSHPT